MCICLKCDRKKYKPIGAFYLAFVDEETKKAEEHTFCQAGYWKNGKIPFEKGQCRKNKEKEDFSHESEWRRRCKNVNI